VGLTFLAFFLFEVLKALQVHPVHYLLVGAALVVFYLLLLSLSEHIGFKYSFLASSLAVIGMITTYSFSFLKVRSTSLLLGGILTVLYSYLYVLLQIEDYALLIGSLGVFAVLGTVMFVTRKLDWSSAMRIRRSA
jgi:inner membrane protein